ncbi:hypothetical protein UPYG_G00337330 [Umbra pygmaea]|uniref:SH2 domain-containing protein n=1 Tax=Umbra pygmaea TaxID=75934 RepID=A0ABD0WET8_UMBPY
MDFDYQKLKDIENHRRDERISGLPVQLQKTEVHQQSSQDPTVHKIPPIKPRRSLKVPKTHRDEVGIQAKQTSIEANKMVAKRMSPALTLGAPGPLEPLSPSLRAQTLLWFERSQLPRLRRPGHALPHWLHGFATRREAEELLKDKQQGCFLLRLSESKIGFVLSYRGKDRCRHFIIEEEGEDNERGRCYLITGEESRHGSLQELVSYYTKNPVGPFNETLTTPCDESRESCVDTVKLGLQDQEKTMEKEASGMSSTAPLTPEVMERQEIPARSGPNNDRIPEYAAVMRKVLKKSNSLPENQFAKITEVMNLLPPIQDDATKPVIGCGGACGGGDDPTEAPYAKVNKPLKGFSNVTTSPYVNVSDPPGQEGTTAASIPETQHGSAGDPGYWKLEPLHTYEETPHLPHREEEAEEHIDFYAMGHWRNVHMSPSGRDPQNHVYSEVNIRGSREVPGLRTTPNLPSRPPPRAVYCPTRPDGGVQQRGEPPLSLSPSQNGVFIPPLTDDHGNRIYEQIPERPTSSRPPLPPPNPKH